MGSNMKVAIIGAGMSGSLLANKLNEQGVDVTVIEKSRGRGGRMSTKRLSWANCDMGAQYFTFRDCQTKPLLQRWQSEGLISPWPFEPSRIRGGVLLSSFDKEERYVSTPDMNSLAKSLLTDVKIKLNCRVNRVTRDDTDELLPKWFLWDEQGDLIGVYNWIVSTIPAEQAADLFETEPEIYQSIPKRVHSPCWAVTIATKGEVHDDVQGVFGEREVSWLARQTTRPGREGVSSEDDPHYDDIWNIHFSPEFTEQHKDKSAAMIETMAFDWLNQLLIDNDKTEGIVAVEGYCHYWRYARLSLDYEQQVEQQGCNAIVDSSQQVAIIGDWTCGGRVEGAMLSALLCYEKLLPYITFNKKRITVGEHA